MRSARLAIAILSLTFTYAAFGQTGGTITGLISDPAGAVVSNAPVEAKNTATGVVLSAATSATGNYVFGSLPAGAYEISVSAPGFKKFVRTGITVQTQRITRPIVSTAAVIQSMCAPPGPSQTSRFDAQVHARLEIWSGRSHLAL